MNLIKENEPLHQHCSYKTGGLAKYFAEPENNDDLIAVLDWSKECKLPLFIIGCGSNILFSDTGVDGLVISLKSLNIKMDIENDLITAGAGVVLDDLVRFSIENGYAGMECLSGIPGCIGGNIFMNAGAFGTEMKDIVHSITVLDENHQIRKILNHDVGFEYRNTRNLKNKIVLSACFKLKTAECSTAISDVRCDIISKRNEKQPLNFPSCGSVFKRPEGNYAGTLIEQCGLKGTSIGGAVVSKKHANFIINEHNATSTDIYDLIQLVKVTVKKETGVTLEEELKLIGF